MKYFILILFIVFVSIIVGTISSDYFIKYNQEYELENFIISCMQKFGHYNDELLTCLNRDFP